ncbi:uncharacterized protein TrAtP1_011835 [Trichoderma atroviride]|uniref:uncharacterized protein n=1 Tax=Hypocrea atroviridis TaxID=63577 RepID=UPI00332F7C29|nr:hypothetical protein TrAtP1_011835 [Trichoderma atroviride]
MDTEIFHIDAKVKSFCNGLSEEDIQAFAELREDPINDAQIEFYIYLCFLHFQKSKDMKSLKQAKQRAKKWAAATPAHHPDYNRRRSLLNTVTIWGRQSQAREKDIEAVALEEPGREKPATDIQLERLREKVSRLYEDFKQHGRREDLEEAIETGELAISIAGPYISPFMSLSLAILLSDRFEMTGSMDDLDRAVGIARNAVDAVPHDDAQQAAFLGSLGKVLGVWFEQTGSMDDMDQAISMINKAVDATPCDNPLRWMQLHNLSVLLGLRFDQTGSIDDLNRGFSAASDAVDRILRGHPNYVSCLSNFGDWLCRRSKRAGSKVGSLRAFRLLLDAAHVTPHNHPGRVVHTYNLGNNFGLRFGNNFGVRFGQFEPKRTT